jgi:hypothetical protein
MMAPRAAAGVRSESDHHIVVGARDKTQAELLEIRVMIRLDSGRITPWSALFTPGARAPAIGGGRD